MTIHISTADLAQLHAFWHNWWWAVILVCLSVPSSIGGRLATRHKRRLELAQARAAAPATVIEREREVRPPQPDGCQHRRVTDVRDTTTGKLLGYVCMRQECGKQFPPDYDFEYN